MKKWYYWLILTLIWIIAAVINYLDNKSIIGALVVCGVSLLFGLCQYFCDKHGDTGKKVLHYIYIWHGNHCCCLADCCIGKSVLIAILFCEPRHAAARFIFCSS